jgi:acyl carrier protein
MQKHVGVMNVAERGIAERVRRFVTSNFYVDSGAVADDASLLEQGIVDSTGVLEIVAFLETEFGIEVKDDELLPRNLDSISAISAYIERKKPA